MENEYGIPIINKYSMLIDDDEDIEEKLQRQNEMKEAEKSKKNAKNEQDKSTTTKVSKQKKALTPVQQDSSRGGRQSDKAPGRRDGEI